MNIPTFDKLSNHLIVVFMLVLSMLGLSVILSQRVSAYDTSDIPRSYRLHYKGSSYIYYNDATNKYEFTTLPTIHITAGGCDASTPSADYSLVSTKTFTNCKSLSVQEKSMDSWFERARFSFAIGDFDHSETMTIGGGVIAGHGSSSNNPTNGGQSIVAKTGANGCDSPNPDFDPSCTVYALFNNTSPGDFGISLGNSAGSSDHEYWYRGPVRFKYYTLTFNPNYGSVVENSGDADTLISHRSSDNIKLLREYEVDSTADNFPKPERPGYTFLNWKDPGGVARTSVKMTGNVTLTANWRKDPTNPPPLTSHECRPIQFVVAPWNSDHDTGTVPIGSVYGDHGSFYSGKYYSGMNLVSGGAPWYSATQFDATDNYTTGDAETISYTEQGRSWGWWHYGHHTEYYYVDDTGTYWDDSGWYLDSSRLLWKVPDKNGKYWWDAGFIWESYTVYPTQSRDVMDWTPPQTRTLTVGPCYNYQLQTGIGDVTDVAEPETSVAINSYVSSSKYEDDYTDEDGTVRQLAHTKSRPSEWRLTQFIFNPGNIVEGFMDNETNNIDPASHFSLGADDSRVVKSGISVFRTNGSVESGGSLDYQLNIGDVPAGTKYCYALSVRWVAGIDKSDGDSDWNHSSFSKGNNCVVVGKIPKFQVWGGDVGAGGSIIARFSTRSGNTFGSWVEYSMFARGGISSIASGSALNNTNGVPISSIGSYGTLSFANYNNSSCSGGVGCYYIPPSPVIQNIRAFFPGGSGISGSVTPSSLNSGTYNAGGGDITLEASQLPAGKRIIIKTSGTVTINGDQTYAGSTYSKITDIPQLVIIAGDIVISGRVKTVDAWLVADNMVETCRGGLSSNTLLTIITCSEQLRVNGPVITNHLYLSRTAGSGTGVSKGDPAEIFNLRADAYLWARSLSLDSGVVRSTYTINTPPRL